METKWTRRLKMPCIMIAGMTPTTSLNGVNLVAAAANAGYWAELAGGGLPRAHIFRERVEMLCSESRYWFLRQFVVSQHQAVEISISVDVEIA